jgi:putative ABC transport system permease protein
VLAARNELLDTVGATLAAGTWFNGATARYPTVVLGATAAERLGVTAPSTDVRIRVGDRWFTVIGVLNPVPLVPELDLAAMVGWPAAKSELRFDGYPTTVYTRTRDEAVVPVRALLGRTANPEHPNEVVVSRPSDALAAKLAANTTLSGLLLGLGAVSLLVGGVGIANTMVISVLERRHEIGLRRSLGATRGHVRVQFLAESLLLSTLGGAGGIALGLAVTTGFAAYQHWPTVVPEQLPRPPEHRVQHVLSGPFRGRVLLPQQIVLYPTREPATATTQGPRIVPCWGPGAQRLLRDRWSVPGATVRGPAWHAGAGGTPRRSPAGGCAARRRSAGR